MSFSNGMASTQILIIGTGFAGLGMAIQLQKAGFEDFLLIEKEPDVGGTWFVNTYPGCACDVQSHMYSFSFEPNPNWTRAFSPQPEILAYLRRCADKYGVRPRIRFGTQAIGARYDEAARTWHVRTADAQAVQRYMQLRGLKPGDALPEHDEALPASRTITARVVVAAMGGLSTPAYPEIKGIERFRGVTFHSQRWDHDYDLTKKRVAVVGTGASAIQFVPQIQPKVARVDLYQRTPPWILPKPDRAISGLERWLYRSLPATRLAHRLQLYLQLESRAVAFVVAPPLMRVAERAARLYLASQIGDHGLRQRLTPDYSIGCKRVLMSNDWYPALRQPNVDVIGTGIAEIREHAIVDAAGVERPVDAIIFGTGFRVSDLVPRNTIRGRAGRDIADSWPDGPQAYKGTTVAGFPNLFLLMGPNTGLGHNSVVYMIESQINYVIDALRMMRDQQLAELEVRRSVQDEFNAALQARSLHTIWKEGGCKSWYLHPVSGRNIVLWPDFTFRFRWLTRRFDPQHYLFRRAEPEPLRAARHLRAV